MDAKIIWADSRGKVIGVLIVLLVASLMHEFRAVFVWHIVLSLILVVCFDSLILWIRSKRWIISLSSIITGLLIGLIFDPLSGFFPTLAASLLASASKNFINKGMHTHIFNPAALGILISSLLFNRTVAWWVSSWGFVPVITLGVGMAPILWKLHRFWMPTTFLIVYFLIHVLTSNFTTAWRLTLDGTIFIFAFVMLPEPKTAPSRGVWQYGWGILVGLLLLFQNIAKIAFSDALLLALLLANLVGFIFVRNHTRN